MVARSGGQPLFVLSNAVDDREMAITHVIRGEDLLSSTPKGLLLWAALDLAQGPQRPVPTFAHLPLLVNEARKKLSKRREEVAVEAYRDQGFLPEAFRNYLALLGWSPPGQQEKVPTEVLVAHFALEDVHSAPAFFDQKKLTHLNGEYLRALAPAAFAAAGGPWVFPEPEEWHPPEPPPWPPERFDSDVWARLAPLVQERVTTLGEIPAMVDFVFLADPPVDQASWERAMVREPQAPAIVERALDAFASCQWTPEVLHATTREIGESVGRSLAKAQAPIRVAVTGRRVGPPLFESLAVVGRQETLRRLAVARERLAAEGDGSYAGPPPPA